MTAFGCCSAMLHPQGHLLERKCIPCSSTVSVREVRPSQYLHENCKVKRPSPQYLHLFKRPFPCDIKRSFICEASPNNHRRNPDFSRHNRGFSRGRSRQNQEKQKADNNEDSDILSSKNGRLPSLSSNTRYQATSTPGQREKEIVELFRKVQAQLRERAAIKEEKRIEAFQHGQGEKGTVDSLLKLLRKHSVDQGKRVVNEEEHIMDEQSGSEETNNHHDDEQNPTFFGTNSLATDEDVKEPETVTSARPVSRFQRRSPVPRVKFQPVFSADDDAKESHSRVADKNEDADVDKELEPIHEEAFEENVSDSFDLEYDTMEETEETSVVENLDLNSMKLVELRELAKSRGVKRYSKLKKMELIELLETTLV